MAGVIEMSDRELTRLRVMIDLADDRLTVDAAATLMGLGRRQIYRLRRIFSADGPAGLASRKRGRPSNRKYGETFRATVLSLVREHYPDFGPTLAVDTSRSADRRRDATGYGSIAATNWPPRISRDDDVNVWANSCRSMVPNTAGSRTAARCVLCWRSLTTRPAD